MKCPKCGFVSFDNIEKCKKCGKVFKSSSKITKDNVIKLVRTIEKKEIKNIEQDLSQSRLKESPIPATFKIEKRDNLIETDDDFGLITEKPTEHISLEKLPVVPRFFATAIDLAILLSINFTLIIISSYIIGTTLSSLLTMKIYFIILFLLMYYLYYTYFTLIYNATIGKKIMKLRVISIASLKPTKLTFQQISWRWLSMIAGILLLFISIIYMLFDEDNAALHDRLSLTLVVSETQFNALQIDELNR